MRGAKDDETPGKTLAVGTGFIQLFRGIGQVLGVALASAIFQHVLSSELHHRITGPSAEDLITQIRHDATLVERLPPELKEAARESYAIGLRWVFVVATVCTGVAYCVRLFIRARSLDDPVQDEDEDGDEGSTEQSASRDEGSGRGRYPCVGCNTY
ncbi:hypothetical protein NMY22_g18681 [Coprinellus aureogranulatus]|nr:hypothetical protein NMY22_g18681 [Coprinellus aureogranulatus]